MTFYPGRIRRVGRRTDRPPHIAVDRPGGSAPSRRTLQCSRGIKGGPRPHTHTHTHIGAICLNHRRTAARDQRSGQGVRRGATGAGKKAGIARKISSLEMDLVLAGAIPGTPDDVKDKKHPATFTPWTNPTAARSTRTPITEAELRADIAAAYSVLTGNMPGLDTRIPSPSARVLTPASVSCCARARYADTRSRTLGRRTRPRPLRRPLRSLPPHSQTHATP